MEGGHQPDFFGSSGALRGYKRDLYEGGIRVPFFARWSGTISPGSKSEHISASWDFFATACAIAEIDPPENIDGISFLPTLLGLNQPQHSYLYWEFHEGGGKQAVRIGDWKGVRNGINSDTLPDIELFDLNSDQSESIDISDEHPQLINQLKKIMIDAHQPSEHFPLDIDSIKTSY
jgi:arylsulfatase A-like enzyme